MPSPGSDDRYAFVPGPVPGPTVVGGEGCHLITADGRRLLVVNDGMLRVFGAAGRLVARSDPADGRVVDAVFRPGTHDVLVARTRRGQSTVAELGSRRTIFAGTGVFDEITPSSDGRWLVVEWSELSARMLQANAPNPFTGATTIAVEMPRAGHARLGVFNARGEEVALLVDGTLTAGTHTITFDGAGLPAGTYFARLVAGGAVESRPMVLVR